MAGPSASEIVHATSVAWQGKGLTIFGPSGSGKSELALTLMAWGAQLVADDGTRLTRRAGQLWADCPDTIAGRIEARGLGILAAEASPPVPLVLAVDLGVAETQRLPPRRQLTLLGVEIPLVRYVENAHFPAAILQYLKAGRVE